MVLVGAVDFHAQVVGEVLCLHHHFDAHAFANGNFAEIDCAAHNGINQLGVAGGLRFAGVHLAHLVTPDVFFKSGVVDERVTVVLNLENGFVAVDFFLTNRIFACPVEQHVVSPFRQGEVAAVRQHIGVLPGVVLIACSHIEIGSGKVAFIFVGRLKHALAASAHARLRSAHFAHAVVERCFQHLAQREVVFGSVGCGIRWIQVVDVGVGFHLVAAPPTFRERVFAVQAACAAVVVIFFCCFVVAIHVPHQQFAVHLFGIGVGFDEVIPKAVVSQFGVRANHVVNGVFQGSAFLAVERSVVAVRHCSPSG